MKRLALSTLALLVSLAGTAHAQKVLIYGPGDNKAAAYFPPGATSTVVTAAQWAVMTTAQFAAYDVLWIGDDNCATSPTIFDSANANRNIWGAAVTGRIHITGADVDSRAGTQPVAQTYIANSVRWLGGQGNTASGGKTGLFIELGCTNTVRSDLLSPFGTFAGSHLDGNPTVINAPSSPLLTGINTVAQLKLDSFAHVTFSTYPAYFQPLDSLGTSVLDLFATGRPGGALQITPSAPATTPRGAISFSASGGSAIGYTWSLAASPSGGSINATSGDYLAGSVGGVTDVVKLTDSTGATAQVNVSVGAGVSVVPPTTTVAPRGMVMFLATGGTGSGYVWSLTTNGSGGTIDAATGIYRAGAKGSVGDVISVRDGLGNAASASIAVTAGVTVTPAAPVTTPRGAVSFSASGGSGGYVWSLGSNASGATLNASTGAYVAGALGNVSDVVVATDSNGNSSSATVSVGSGPSITPAVASAPPRGGFTFVASGGAGGYVWSLSTNHSGGSINATSGAYVAGPLGSVSDVVQVADELGNLAVATVAVGASVAVSPSTASIAPHGSVAFSATGGTGGGYHWAIGVNHSSGTIDPNSGVYVAGAVGNVSDVIVVVDPLGNSATATVQVSAALAIAPTNPSSPPRGTIAFVPVGGSGSGYVWSLTSSPSGGSIGAGSGTYVAGATGGVSDVVRLTDSLGNVAVVTVPVSVGISIVPSPATAAPRGTVMFLASGGSGGGYSWALAANHSGGSIDAATGLYTAGAAGSVSDTVRVTDPLGNSATVNVAVSAVVSISPPSASVSPRGSLGFTAAGGSGSGYKFTLGSNGSGATINATSGVYKAGNGCNVSDVVIVTDGSGNSASAIVSVTGCLVVSPPSAATTPRGTIAFAASGGSGSAYSWSLAANHSGGSISASGLYSAGLTPSVVDIVAVVDSLGNVATATVNVGAGLAITPLSTTTPPRGSVAFSAGGGAPPYLWALSSSPSGSSINATTGAYKAGAVGSVSDVVTVTDSVGASVSASVSVSAGVTIAPSSPTTAPRGSIAFVALGGSGSDFVWKLVAKSGGSISPSGAYVAGPTGNVVDVVSVSDGLGNSASVNVQVTGGVTITPAEITVTPRAPVTFSAAGGSGSAFTFAFISNASGGTLSTGGAYVAGNSGSVDDTLSVTDGLGNSASAVVHVGAALKIVPASASVSPHGALAFAASGGAGGYKWHLAPNASGGSIDNNSGAYVAGATGSVTDVVVVSDSLGATASAKVTVGAGIVVTPAQPSIPPRGVVAFGATGGAGSGYVWSLSTNSSGGSINPTSGVYTAGAQGDVTDVVIVVDGLGNISAVPVTVTTGVHPSPSSAATPPRGTLAFTVAGGNGGTFTWSFQTNASGGTLVPGGASAVSYAAGPVGSVTDVIRVADSLGNFATITVAVGAGIVITPAQPVTPPDGAITFVAGGGSGSGYVWSIATGSGAGSCSGGTVDVASGAYRAGPQGSCADAVAVTDSLGNTASVTVSVGAGVTITPSSPVVPPRQSVTFSAAGGAGGGYVWAFVGNASGGTLTSNGVYVAGPTGGVTDLVSVTDALGNQAATSVQVTAAPFVTPATATVPPRGSVDFAVAGGSGLGFSWSLTTNGSGATLDAATGRYVAGPTGNVSDVVTVRDSLDNQVSVTIHVSGGVVVTPAATTSAPRGSIVFGASGGSGSGFGWQLVTNGSGGTISANGTYVAGSLGNVTDVVLVSDSLGNLATATIAVSAGVTITPAKPTSAPLGKIKFTASGGSNSGFSWVISSNGSQGSIKPKTGAYVAGKVGSSTDVVTVTDSLGNQASVSVSVGAGITINPTNAQVAPRGALGFSATGGAGAPYSWTLGANPSGGTIDGSTGAYVAGAVGNVSDTIVVTDTLGNSATGSVGVGPGLTISPPNAAVAPLGKVAFTVAGGSGAGYAWAITDNLSNGTIDATTGSYVAGPVGGVVDSITASDSFGNRAQVNVTVSAALSITPPTAVTPPRGHVQLTGHDGAGGYVFTLSQNGSGGHVNASSGDYQAGSSGNVSDKVQVTDANGALAVATISVGPGVAISPSAPAVPPRGSVSFTAAGGSGSGFVFSLLTSPSGGSIDVAGHYVAGAHSNAIDVVHVVDSLGNGATVAVSVGAGVSVNPPQPTVSPRGTIAFTSAGGAGPPFTWTLAPNASGGSIDAGGNYVAGPNGNVTDVVTASDALGNSASVNITVGPGVTVAPASANLAPLGRLVFTVAGGSGNGYSWFLLINGSGGSVNASTGAYTAGTIGNSSDVVAVIDSLGNLGQASVTVGPALTLTPALTSVSPRGTVGFSAAGGSGGYKFSFLANGSGGFVSSTSGAYTAGATGNSTDRIQVVDSNGSFATARITVGPGIAVVPAMPTVLAHESIAFIATGGQGSGFTWSLLSSPSGGTIDPASGIYSAGGTIDVTDVVQVVDALGNSALVNVMVGLGITINPAHATVPPRGSIAFGAVGGTGAGYGWSLISNGSGGTIDSAAGQYQAGSIGNVTDVVEVSDSIGNASAVPVTVGPALTVAPANSMIAGGRTIGFSVVGGSGSGYRWSLIAPIAGSTIDPVSGLYHAGAGPGHDIVRVTDSLGNSGAAAVGVGASALGAAAQAALDQANASTPAGSTTVAATIPTARATGGGCQLGDATPPTGAALVFASLVLLAALRRRRSQ